MTLPEMKMRPALLTISALLDLWYCIAPFTCSFPRHSCWYVALRPYGNGKVKCPQEASCFPVSCKKLCQEGLKIRARSASCGSTEISVQIIWATRQSTSKSHSSSSYQSQTGLIQSLSTANDRNTQSHETAM